MILLICTDFVLVSFSWRMAIPFYYSMNIFPEVRKFNGDVEIMKSTIRSIISLKRQKQAKGKGKHIYMYHNSMYIYSTEGANHCRFVYSSPLGCQSKTQLPQTKIQFPSIMFFLELLTGQPFLAVVLTPIDLVISLCQYKNKVNLS